MFHVEVAPLGGILGPLKSDLGVFWLYFGLFFAWFYNVKTQKTRFLQNRSTEMAKIDNMHNTICLQLISSSGQIALPPAFARLEQRGVAGYDAESHKVVTEDGYVLTIYSQGKKEKYRQKQQSQRKWLFLQDPGCPWKIG